MTPTFLEKLAQALSDLAEIERATAKFIVSTLLLLATVAVPVLLYFYGKSVWAAQPHWVKWMAGVLSGGKL